MCAIAFARQMAELGQHTAVEPTQQLCAFVVAQSNDIVGHGLLHPRPVTDRSAHIAQSLSQPFFQLLTLAGVDTLGFDINHRLGRIGLGYLFAQSSQLSCRVAPNRDYRMHQAIDRQALGRDRRSD